MMATPTYVLGMAATARNKLDIDPASLTINKITCAGEPGASIPTTKKRMEEAWGAKVFFDYKVTRNNEIIFSKTFNSNYHPWQAVFLRGTAPVN